jgi:hypothetical protein
LIYNEILKIHDMNLLVERPEGIAMTGSFGCYTIGLLSEIQGKKQDSKQLTNNHYFPRPLLKDGRRLVFG